jgi:hydrogenase maturation protease
MGNIGDGRKIVIGLGNILNKDEGLGVHAVALLKTKLEEYAPDVEFLDGGALGLNLLPWVEEASHLLVLDSIDSRNAHPGQVIELSRDEIPLYRNIKMSDHQISFQEVLGLAKIRSKLPEYLYLVGAKPVDMSIGVGLSPEIEAKIPDILVRAEQVLTKWQLLAQYSPNKLDQYQ